MFYIHSWEETTFLQLIFFYEMVSLTMNADTTYNFNPAGWSYRDTPTTYLQRGKALPTSLLDMTLNNMIEWHQ